MTQQTNRAPCAASPGVQRHQVVTEAEAGAKAQSGLPARQNVNKGPNTVCSASAVPESASIRNSRGIGGPSRSERQDCCRPVSLLGWRQQEMPTGLKTALPGRQVQRARREPRTRTLRAGLPTSRPCSSTRRQPLLSLIGCLRRLRGHVGPSSRTSEHGAAERHPREQPIPTSTGFEKGRRAEEHLSNRARRSG